MNKQLWRSKNDCSEVGVLSQAAYRPKQRLACVFQLHTAVMPSTPGVFTARPGRPWESHSKLLSQQAGIACLDSGPVPYMLHISTPHILPAAVPERLLQ